MNALFGFILFFFMCLVDALIASKKGRSGILFFFAFVLAAVPLFFLVTYVTGADQQMMNFAPFLSPAIGFIIAIMADNKEQMAVKTGDFGDYTKCTFCAESVRKEAIKCKHCGSDISNVPA